MANPHRETVVGELVDGRFVDGRFVEDGAAPAAAPASPLPPEVGDAARCLADAARLLERAHAASHAYLQLWAAVMSAGAVRR